MIGQLIKDLKFTDIKEAKIALTEIERQYLAKMEELKGAESHKEWTLISNERYELLKVRRRIQSEIARLFYEGKKQ